MIRKKDEEIRKKDKEIRKKDQEIRKLHLTIAARDRQIRGNNVEVNEQVRRDKDFWMQRTRQVESQMAKNDAMIESLKKENAKLIDDYEIEKAELQQKNEKLEKRVSDLQGDVKSLRSSLWHGKDTYSEQEIARLEVLLKDSNATFQSLTEKVKKCEKVIYDRNAKLQTCKVRMEEKDAVIRNLEAKNFVNQAHASKSQIRNNEKMKKQMNSYKSQIIAKENQLRRMMQEQDEADVKFKENNNLLRKINSLEKQLKTVKSRKDADDDIKSIETVQVQKIIIPEITIVDDIDEAEKQNQNAKNVSVSEFQFDSDNAASKPKRMKTEVKSEEKVPI